MKATATIQKSKSYYFNIPKKIAEKMNIQKGETVLFEVIDEDTLQIKIVED